MSNHVSDADPWRIAIEFDGIHIHWWAKKELCNYNLRYQELRETGVNRLLSALLALGTLLVVKPSKVIPVDRNCLTAAINTVAIKQSFSVLKNGGVVGIFGAGGKKQKGEAKPIFVKLAERCKVPIVVVNIDGKHLSILEVIRPGELSRFGNSPAQVAESIMNKVEICQPV